MSPRNREEACSPPIGDAETGPCSAPHGLSRERFKAKSRHQDSCVPLSAEKLGNREEGLGASDPAPEVCKAPPSP